MKNQIILNIIIFMTLLVSCKVLHSQSETEDLFDSFARESSYYDFNNLREINQKWRKLKNDTVIYTTYFKGAECDIPDSERMSIKITNDTLIFNFGMSNKDANCERRFGVAGIMIDFVVNKKKFPNYKDLKIKYITRD